MSDVIPQSPEAEESVLGGMLLSSAAADKAAATLKSEMFYRESHGVIFECMTELLERGVPTDTITVTAALEQQGKLEGVGGKVRLYELGALVPATANILHYAKLVKKAWQRRMVLREVVRIQNDIETLEDPVATLELAAMELEQLTADRHELVVDIKDLVAAKREAMKTPQAIPAGVEVPFSFLDKLIGGRLYVLGGYMGDGKTAASLQFARKAAETGERVGFVSAEMSKQDLFDRWAVQMTGLPYWKVKNPFLLDLQQSQRLDEALVEMESWNVHVIDDEAIDPSRIRRYQRAGKFTLLLVDHLHRMRHKDRHDLEGKIISITNIAREFDVPVLLLAQLSRAGDYKDPFPVPSMRQFRETAMIEAEASGVWFVYRERDDSHVPGHRTQFIVAKNRYGKTDSQAVIFNESTQAFEEQSWEPVLVEAAAGDGFPF